MSRNIALYDLGQCKQACHLEPIKRAKAPLSIRYTSDSHGQGVHAASGVFKGLILGQSRIRPTFQPTFGSCKSPCRRAWVTRMGSASCSEWQTPYGSFGSCLTV
jgi:hypothetical protein